MASEEMLATIGRAVYPARPDWREANYYFLITAVDRVEAERDAALARVAELEALILRMEPMLRSHVSTISEDYNCTGWDVSIAEMILNQIRTGTNPGRYPVADEDQLDPIRAWIAATGTFYGPGYPPSLVRCDPIAPPVAAHGDGDAGVPEREG